MVLMVLTVRLVPQDLRDQQVLQVLRVQLVLQVLTALSLFWLRVRSFAPATTAQVAVRQATSHG